MLFPKLIAELDEEIAGHVFKVAVKVARALKQSLDLEGLNVVQNNGEIAGQTVFHFHMHLIPRYKGDTVNVGWEPGEISAEELKELKLSISENL